MRIQGSGTTPWQKILKFMTNPMVEVLVAIVVMLVSAWIVIDSESMQRKTAYPILFGK
jgi:hypothetical protein